MNACFFVSVVVSGFLIGETQAQYTIATYSISGSDTMTAASVTGGDWTGYTLAQVTVTGVGDTTVTAQGCAAGTWAASDSSTCTSCVAGKYSGTAQAVSEATCIPCDPGKWSATVGATSVSTCQSCGPNTYSSTSGANSVATCLSCPQFSSSYAASNAITACVCNAGYSGANGGFFLVGFCDRVGADI